MVNVQAKKATCLFIVPLNQWIQSGIIWPSVEVTIKIESLYFLAGFHIDFSIIYILSFT